ncbi:non-ribosomal peptide synthetase modules and related proteins [Rhodococcus wratislaviensis]|uniref:Non-ribosomal peptide synthetase modules and related proteins n=1 Tax=Rhodococcus wratislaviensis TaxID=44752 RepID=A0A402CL81_RHOWR|nr:GNAT family N-acetyltransferase [Rhodococcus wratislaviensis]GCE44390.1 non-ribosomal peptide synthetase modules and related proteins [Rhodococcus wratislaviensis]
MRLTNVAHLRLPFGRLLGYDVTVGRLGRPLPVSFDQRRHVGAGDRAGSWMALSFTLSAPVPSDALAAAWLAVVARHGTLRSIFSPGEDGEPRLHEVEIFPGDWVEHPIAPGQAVNDALRDVLDHACPPYSRPSHRLCVLETAAGPTVVVAADHSHVDMWSMLVIARDLLTALAAVQDGRVPSLPPAPAFAEHTRALRDCPAAPAEVHHRWAEVLAASGDVMPRFPLSLGAATLQQERVEVRDVLDVDDSAAFSAQARDDGVSTLALVVAAMTDVTRELAGTPLRAVFPVHSRYDATWNDSVGWFITNSVLESTDPDPRASAEAVKEAVRMGSWPLEDVLRPWGGMPEAPGMFAISWLDLRRLPVRVDATGLEAQYVGATIRTDGVMLWFILDEAGLHLRCRYPDTPEARQHVGTWLDTLIAHLQSRARESVGGRLPLGDRVYRVQRAGRADVPALVALLSDDEIGRTREGAEMARYEEAYDAIARDSAHYLAVVRAEDDRIIGTMQLTIIPGLSRGGTARLQIEGVRVAATERSHGVGTAMLEWAHDHGRHRGATLVQVTTDRARERAQAFYARLGYDSSHVGFKRAL